MSELLADQTAVVTGGSSGIGRAISLAYAEEGADVVIADIREEPRQGGESTHERISEATSARAHFVECDVSNPKQVEKAVETAENEFGNVDVMVIESCGSQCYNPSSSSEYLTNFRSSS